MAAPLRVYLTGRLCVEADDVVLDEHDLPGRQGRALLARLALSSHAPQPRSALADDLWQGAPPAAWDSALSALISKLRRALGAVHADATVASEAGCYRLVLPPRTWIDVEVAAEAAHDAEAHLRRGDPAAAWGSANVAVTIAARPLLPGEEGAWLERERQRLHDVHVRALDCLAAVWTATGELALARGAATKALELEPFRESAYRRLMAVHAAAGDRGEALRVYERCRALLATELGADPSPETQRAHRALLEG